MDSPEATSDTTSRSRAVSDDIPGTGVPGALRTANSEIRRRVTPGDSSDSPAATTRTARISSATSVSFTQNPAAPARRAPKMYSSIPNVVSTSTRTSAREGSEQMDWVAAIPSSPGIRMSISTTSGRSDRASRTASCPSPAVPATACAIGLGFASGKGYPVTVGGGTFFDWGAGHLAGGALLGALGVVAGALVRSQIAAVIGAFVWSIICESLLGGLFPAARPYLPYSAAAALAGTPLGAASFGPGRGATAGAPLPFAAAVALLAALTIVLGLIAARSTVRRDVT